MSCKHMRVEKCKGKGEEKKGANLCREKRIRGRSTGKGRGRGKERRDAIAITRKPEDKIREGKEKDRTEKKK